MKTFLVLGGYGEMGRIASRDLSETAKGARIIIAGRDEKKAKAYARQLGKSVRGAGVDVTKFSELTALLKRHKVDVVVNCTLYYYNLNVMEACLAAGCSYVDLGGLFHMTKKQLRLHDKFRKKGLLAVLGMGSTPGISNVLAGYGYSHLDRVHAVHIRFADYSWSHPDTHFVVPYSMYTVFDEFTSKPAVLENGTLKFVKPVSGKTVEYFPYPIGEIHTFYTLHSELATFPESFRQKGLKTCDFKVGFDEDFVHDVEILIEAGLSDKKEIEVAGKRVRPIDVAVKELNRLIPDNAHVKDMEYIRATLMGHKHKKHVELVIDCISYSNPKWKAAAGDVNTGTPPSIVAQMIADGRINAKGVLPPELSVPPIPFFHELTKRGMRIVTRTKVDAFG